MRKEEKVSRSVREWIRPEVKKTAAGLAEANGAGDNDGGPVGNARS